MQSGILPAVDPRNVAGLFISGYEGLDAGELSGLHRYEADWTHTFDPTEIEEFRNEPCPVADCVRPRRKTCIDNIRPGATPLA